MSEPPSVEDRRRRYASRKVYAPRWIPPTTPVFPPFISSPELYVSRCQYFTILIPFSYVALSLGADRGITLRALFIVSACYIVRDTRLLRRAMYNAFYLFAPYAFAC